MKVNQILENVPSNGIIVREEGDIGAVNTHAQVLVLPEDGAVK